MTKYFQPLKNKTSFLKNENLVALLSLGLFLRILLAFLPGFKIDVDAWYAWAIRLNDLGLPSFYSSQVWTNYTPGFLYVLYLLGFIKNILNLNSDAFYYILKFPAIISDLMLAIFIYREIRQKFSEKISLVISSFFLFAPAVIFDSTIWGQIDSILALFMFLTIFFLAKKRINLSALFFALAFLIKPQALALCPLLLFYFIKNFDLKKIAKFFSISLGTFVLLFIPFVLKTSPSNIPGLILNMANDYSYTSLFAFNFWGAVGFWIPDSGKLISFLTFQQFGIILYVIYWIIVFIVGFKKKLSLYALAALACLSFYFLPTRVHERYLFPALPFLALVIPHLKSKIFTALSLILSLLYFVNLYFVYFYYNFNYYHIPSPIYWLNGYNAVNNNTKWLSILGTIIFAAISSLILTIKLDEKV